MEPCEHAESTAAGDKKQTSFDPTDKPVKATLLEINRECVSYISVMCRFVFPNKSSFLRFGDHSFSVDDVEVSLQAQFS